MPPQQKDSFVPDSFVADTDSFVADSFVPDKKEELQFETVEVRPGQFMSVKKGETPAQALKRVENRPDTGLYRAGERGAPEEGFNRISQGITNRIATSSWIPESFKGPLASLASLHTEPFRLATDILANPQPEDILVPSIVNPKSLSRTLRAPAKLPRPGAEGVNLMESKITPKEAPLASSRINLLEPKADTSKAVQKAKADARFEKFMEPSIPGGEQHLPQANLGIDLRNREVPVGMWEDHPVGTIRDAQGRPVQVPSNPALDQVLTDTAESLPLDDTGKPNWQASLAPQRFWPRTAQTSLEALVPDRLKVPPSVAESVGEASAEALPTGGKLRDKIDTPRPGAPKPKIDAPTERFVRDIEPVAPGVRELAVNPASEQAKGWARILADHITVSGRKRMERLGPIPTEARKLLNIAELDKREIYNQLTTPFLNLVKGLDSESEAIIQSALDFDTPIADPALNQIKDQIKDLLTKSGEMAEAAGVRVENLKGEFVPFKKRDVYWPRRSTKLHQGKKRDFVAELMANNEKLSLAKAQRIAQRAMENAEFLDSFQRQRIPKSGPIKYEYRKDLGAVLDHFAEIADKIARAKHLGPGDIANRTSTISRLIESAPKEVQSELRDLITTQLKGGMNDRNAYFSAMRKAKRAFTKGMIFMKLAPYVVSNINQQLAIASRGTIGTWLKALTTMPENRALAREYGTVLEGNIPANILSEAGNKPVPYVGPMIKWAEDYARSVATGAGRGAAQRFFTAAKEGSKASTKKLKDLLLEEDLDQVLKQDQLTPEQLKLATQRFVEITQGLDSNMNIPSAWVNDPTVSVFTIFKNFAFQGTKAIWDGIKQDPYRTIPKLLVMAPLFGELTGDLKSAIYGAIRGGPMPGPMLDAIAFEIANRHRFAGRLTTLDSEESDTDWLVNRIVADYLQSWGLGLVADGLQATMGGESGGYGAVFGPAIETAMSPFEVASDVLQGNFEEAGRETMRQLIPAPFGTSLQKRFLPTMTQEIP